MSVATRYARTAGVLYLIVITCGIFSELAVRGRLIDFDSATATARHISEDQWLFRLGFAADLVVFLSDVAIAVLLYLLFRSISNAVSLTAAGFRLVQTAILGANLLFMFSALLIMSDAEYLTEFNTAQTNGLALLVLEMHKYGYMLALMFFGVHAVLIGWLVFHARFAPHWLGALLALAGFGYLTDGLTHFLLDGYEGSASWIVLAPAFVAEISFCIWLLVAHIDGDVQDTPGTWRTGRMPAPPGVLAARSPR
jgi:hypothetical protein